MRKQPPNPGIGGTLSLAGALDSSATLAQLLQRLQASRERFDAIRDQLPEALRAQVRPGSIDTDGGWTLLATGGAAAAKLRQMLPALQQTLRERGLPSDPIRVRVRAG